MSNPKPRLLSHTSIRFGSFSRCALVLVACLILPGCSVNKKVDKDALTIRLTPLSSVVNPERIKVEEKQVWLDGKLLGPQFQGMRKKYDGLSKVLPAGIKGYELTELSPEILFLSGGEKLLPGDKEEPSAKTFFFNCATKQIENGPDMSGPRQFHNVLKLKDGRLVITGGSTADPLVHCKSVEVFDPKTKTITTAGNVNTGRSTHNAIAVRDDKILLVGGMTDIDLGKGKMEEQTVEIFDLKTGKCETLGQLIGKRDYPALYKISDFEVFVFGGYSSRKGDKATAEIIKLL